MLVCCHTTLIETIQNLLLHCRLKKQKREYGNVRSKGSEGCGKVHRATGCHNCSSRTSSVSMFLNFFINCIYEKLVFRTVNVFLVLTACLLENALILWGEMWCPSMYFRQTELHQKLRERRVEALYQLKSQSEDIKKVETAIFLSGQRLGAVLKENHRWAGKVCWDSWLAPSRSVFVFSRRQKGRL